MIAAYLILILVGILSALAIGFVNHPVHRIAFLVVVFLVGSLLSIIIDFYFLGLTYIIVYCGAIAIIFLFVIMMVTVSNDYLTSKTTNVLLPLVCLVVAAGLVISYEQLVGIPIVLYNSINWGLEFIWLTDIQLLGSLVYIAYPTALIIIGIALFIVMIAIIKLTQP